MCFALLLTALFAFSLSSGAVDADLADTGADTGIVSTGSAYEDLGASFYARIGIQDPDKYMTVPDDPMRTTKLDPYVDSSTQFWHFSRQSDGSYKVRNVNKNLYLELYNGTYPQENNETFHAEVDNLPDQRWFLKKVGDAHQFVTCANTSYLLKGVNLYGSSAEIRLTSDFSKETTHFVITKLPYTGDYLPTPTVKLACVYGGVSITWNSITHATAYRVYRYNASTKKWVSLTKTTGTSYTDKSVSSGTTYQYKVNCISPLTSKDKSYSIKYLAAPGSFKVVNTASGPTISWAKVTGAQAYKVFCKTTGSWVDLGLTTSTSFTHKKASYNVNYTYTVRCASSDGKKFTSAYNTTGIKNRIVQTPKIKVTLNPNGYQLSWNKVTGAYRYMVMIKSKATNWVWAKPTECIYTNYFYSGPANNQAYYFTVRCMDQNKKYISGYTSSSKYTYYAAPRMKSMKITSSKVTLSWNKVAGAAKYAVYSWNGKTWIRRSISVGTSASFKVSGTAKQNKCFMVRCMNKSSKNISSYYETIVSGGKLVYYHPGGYSSKNKF